MSCTVYYTPGGVVLAALEEGRSEEYENILRESGVAFRLTESDLDPHAICTGCAVRNGQVEALYPISVSGVAAAADLDMKIRAAVAAALKDAGFAPSRKRRAKAKSNGGAS